jgi:hypothetical protein
VDKKALDAARSDWGALSLAAVTRKTDKGIRHNFEMPTSHDCESYDGKA